MEGKSPGGRRAACIFVREHDRVTSLVLYSAFSHIAPEYPSWHWHVPETHESCAPQLPPSLQAHPTPRLKTSGNLASLSKSASRIALSTPLLATPVFIAVRRVAAQYHYLNMLIANATAKLSLAADLDATALRGTADPIRIYVLVEPYSGRARAPRGRRTPRRPFAAWPP